MRVVLTSLATSLGLMALSAAPALAGSPEIGEPLPAFEVTTTSGDVISNESLAGKRVILEWTNHQCPFVVKHYGADNMQATQRTTTEDDAVWISVVSSAPGKQGHVTPEQSAELTTSRGAVPTYVVLDESGDLGRLFKAKTTPHMFVADENTKLAYMGAIDSIKSANPADIEKAENYVLSAFASLQAGEEVATPTSKPYGCSVKY
jgi:hypothetical protein